MNKLSALALGTALSLSLPLAALAQDADAGVTLEGGVNTELGGAEDDAGVDAAAGAATPGAPDTGAGAGGGAGAAAGNYTFGDLDDALQGAANADFAAVTEDTRIEIVPISQLAEEGERTRDEYSTSIQGYQGDVTALRGNIEQSEVIVSALEEEGYTVDQVVGVWTQADDSLTIFVDDSEGGVTGTSTDTGAGAGATGGAGAAGGTDTGTDAGAGAGAGADTDTDTDTEDTTTTP